MLELISLSMVGALILLWAYTLYSENRKARINEEMKFYVRLKLLEKNPELHNKAFLKTKGKEAGNDSL